MPLYTFNRTAEGELIQTDKPGRYSISNLTLANEIPNEDFGVSSEEFKDYGLRAAWLEANFDQRIQWVDESADFDESKKDLAKFLNEKMTGPFYVMQGYVNTRQILRVVLFKEEDIKTFRAAYSSWEFKEKAAEENASILALWKEKGRKLQTSSMYDFAAPKI